MMWVEEKRYPNDPDGESFSATSAGISVYLNRYGGRWMLICPFLQLSGLAISADGPVQAQREAEKLLLLIATHQQERLAEFIAAID